MTSILALAAAMWSGLYYPLESTARALVIDEAGAAWLVVQVRVAVPPEGCTVAWDASGWPVEAGSAYLSLPASPPAVKVAQRRQKGSLILWRLVTRERQQRQCTLRLLAPVKDLKVEYEHLVSVAGERALWKCRLHLSNWKGNRTEPIAVSTPHGETTVSLIPGQSVSATIWQECDIPCERVVRWDSKDGGEAARVAMHFARSADTRFARRWLHKGRVTVSVGDQDFQTDFPGAPPGQELWLAAGLDENVRVRRTRASVAQVNVRSDVHRRMAAFDERFEYEYAVVNARAEDVVLEIVEHPSRGWRVEEASHNWRRYDADTIIFTVPLKARARDKVRAVLLRKNVTPE